MVGIFSELEKNLRSERQKIGIKRALSQGVRFGRKDVVDEDKALKFSYCCLKTESIVSFKNSALLSEYVRTLSTGFCFLLFKSTFFNTMKNRCIKT